jgi:putative transposase
MAKPARSAGTGTYFVTSITSGRRRLFQVTQNAELLLEILQSYRHQGYYKLHAFVVMPDHIHLLLTPQDVAVERAVGFIKGGFSRRLESKLAVWQRGFTDHRVRDEEDFRIRREYIHQNPVRAYLVDSPEKYAYSSAYRGETGKPYLVG